MEKLNQATEKLAAQLKRLGIKKILQKYVSLLTGHFDRISDIDKLKSNIEKDKQLIKQRSLKK